MNAVVIGAMERVKEWLIFIMSAAFLLAVLGFIIAAMWTITVGVVMTPIQWWNGDCTAEYARQWKAMPYMPYHAMLEPSCKLINTEARNEALDDEILQNRQEIERLQREIQKLENQKGRRD